MVRSMGAWESVVRSWVRGEGAMRGEGAITTLDSLLGDRSAHMVGCFEEWEYWHWAGRFWHVNVRTGEVVAEGSAV
jgi:hypothetical protein